MDSKAALAAAAGQVHDEADDWLGGCDERPPCLVCTTVGEALRAVALGLATQALEMEVRP